MKGLLSLFSLFFIYLGCMQPNASSLRSLTKEEVYHGLGTEIQNINGIILRKFDNQESWRYALTSSISLANYFLAIPSNVSMSQLKNVDGPVILNSLINLTQKLGIFLEYNKISKLDYRIALFSLINARHILRHASN